MATRIGIRRLHTSSHTIKEAKCRDLTMHNYHIPAIFLYLNLQAMHADYLSKDRAPSWIPRLPIDSNMPSGIWEHASLHSRPVYARPSRSRDSVFMHPCPILLGLGGIGKAGWLARIKSKPQARLVWHSRMLVHPIRYQISKGQSSDLDTALANQ